MALKATIAIIGANDALAQKIAVSIAPQFNLLLMDENVQLLERLSKNIHANCANAHLEVISCSTEASWQADAVLVVANDTDAYKIAEAIKHVTTNKTVIYFTTTPATSFTSLLPNAKVITVVINEHIPDTPVINGTDAEALQLAESIVSAL